MYKVTGKIMNMLEVIGVRIESELGKEENISLEKFSELVKKQEVYGYRNIEVDGNDYIVGEEHGIVSENTVSNSKTYVITAKIPDDNDKIIGYKVRGEDGAELKVSSKKAWELIASKVITNAVVFIRDNNGEKEKVILVEDKALS